MLTLSMVVSMTACGNSDAGGSKDSAKNNGNGDEPYTVTMVLNGSTQPDEERIEQKINEILEPELNANLDICSIFINQFRHVYNLSCIHILHCIGCLGIKDINFFIP